MGRRLPTARLGFAYLNVATIARLAEQGLRGQVISSGPGPSDPPAVETAALSISAEPDGLSLDASERFDPTKLSPDQRAELDRPDHPNPLLVDVPIDAYAVFADQHVDTTLRRLLGGLGRPAPGGTGPLDPATLDGLLQALTGDIAIEVGPGGSARTGAGVVPGGALILGSASDGQMRSVLDQLAAGASAYTRGRWRTERYEGVPIQVYRGRGSTLPISPAYAVVDHVGVVASSAEEMRRIIGTARGGPNITGSPVFRAAAGGVSAPDSLGFVDVRRVVVDVRAALPADRRAAFDREAAPDLRPVISLFFHTQSDVNGSRFRLFVRIG